MLSALASFSLCASSVYVANDLVDLRADRLHPSKRRRPFASGDLSIQIGPILFIVLVAAGFGIAATLSLPFVIVLAGYMAATSAYSLLLKRKMIIDVVTLAGLYSVRVLAGAVAIDVPASEWIVTFSLFIFLALALLKRYSELAVIFDRNLPNPVNRNYVVGDLSAIMALAAAAGYSAVVVFTLYLSSDAVKHLYARPQLLWFCCPPLIYWISRTIMISHRRLMHDDPIVFAITDRVSWAVGILILIVGAAAMVP